VSSSSIQHSTGGELSPNSLPQQGLEAESRWRSGRFDPETKTIYI